MTEQKVEMNFNEWLQYGIDRGWCSDITCAMHDGLDINAEEEQAYIDMLGEVPDDPCMAAVRIY